MPEIPSMLALPTSAWQMQGVTTTSSRSLSKKIYPGSKTDWKVWHFLDDLPLSLLQTDGTVLVHHDWLEIV